MRCLVLAVVAIAICRAATLDFANAVIVIPPNATAPEKKAATMLSEEIEKRTQLRLKVQSQPASGAAFVIGRPDQIRSLGAGSLAGAPDKAEGFTIASSSSGTAVAVITGTDDRGVVFGVGYLLRRLHMARQKLELDAAFHVSTSPKVLVRGHQLGYRPKTNSYDAWSVAMWDQYIRDLAIFGTNAIELIPPRSDDAADSPHFPLPQIEMMVEMSRIADEYGLGCLDLVSGDGQGLLRSEDGRVRAEGVGRGVPASAAHRCGLRPRRRPGPHPAEVPDGAARKADGEPAQISSEGGDVDVAAGLHEGLDERILRYHEDPADAG